MEKKVIKLEGRVLIVDTGAPATMVITPGAQPKYYVWIGVDAAIRDYIVSKNYDPAEFTSVLVIDHEWTEERSLNYGRH